MTPARPGSIALVSGGLDSLVSLAAATREREVRLVLFFDYGQRARGGERTSAVGAASFYGIPFADVDIRWLESLAPAGMQAGGREDAPVQTLDDVWIPNRNGVMVNIAAAYAEAQGCDSVVTGFNREEAVEFPDNSGEYVERVNRALEMSTRNGVRVESFTIGMDKREIIRLGMRLKAPLSIVWSCYRGGGRMCGECASCRRLRAALASLDPGDRPVIEFQT